MEKMSKETKAKISGKEVWVTSYNGHEIKVVNKARTTMYIDGNEAAKQKHLLSSQIILQAAIPDTDKVVMARIYQKSASDYIISCDFIVGDLLTTEYGFQHKDGTVALLNDEEIKQYIQMKKDDDETTTTIISTMF